MLHFQWSKKVKAVDDRRNLIIPGDKDESIIFSVYQFIALANESIKKNGFFYAALSGGSTPNAIFSLISKEPYINQIDWSKVFLFWSDERSVPVDHPDNNYSAAMHAGLESLPIPKNQIYRMPAEKEIEKAALSYDKLIREVVPEGKFDLMMLGMGEDGHTASLFPHTKALHVEDRLAAANYVPEKQTWRMTLTYPCIELAHHICIYVFGASKAEMVKKALKGPFEPENIPIQKVGTEENKALWIIDQAAAQKLS